MVYRQAGRPSGKALRARIVSKARELIERDGPHKLSARKASEDAGASDMASRAHFPGGPTELLAAVAIQGFEELVAILRDPPFASRPAARLTEVIRRYVRFGLDNPKLYRAMFFPSLADKLAAVTTGNDATLPGAETFEALVQTKGKAFDVFVETVAPLFGQGSRSQRRGAAAKASASIAHGLVGEFIDEGLGTGVFPTESLTARRLELTDSVTNTLLHGILPRA